MKLSIWKFPLKMQGYQKVTMPGNAKVLSVQSQNDSPVLWAICDTETEEKEEREFELFGTGNPFYDGNHIGKEKQFVGTFQLNEGSFVGHVFELVQVRVFSGL